MARFGGDEFVVMVGELERDPEEIRGSGSAAVPKKSAWRWRVPLFSVPREGHDPLPVEHRSYGK